MSRATNRTSNISVTWNFKNPNISRNELINFIHLFREVPGYSREVSSYSREVSGYSREVSGYSRVLSRHCLAISAASRFSTAPRSSSGAISPFSSFIFHLSSLIGRTPESFLKGFYLRVSVLPKVSRLLHLKSRDSCYLSISLLPRGLRQAPYRHFHQSPARKSPERLFSPIQRTPESFPTTPPEISRFPFGTKVIKILDLSPYLPPTRPFAVSPTLPYSPTPVLHQPRHQTESTSLVHQSPCTFYPHLTLSYNNTHQSRSLPTMPPDRIHSSRSSIAFHDLSSSHPALQQHSSVQVITNHATRQNPLLSFINLLARSILISPCLTTTLISPDLHQPRHQTESTPLVHQSPSTFYPHLTLSYNNTHQSRSSPTTPPDRIRSSRSSISLHVLSSSHPVLQQHSSVQFITSYNYQVRFPDRPIRIVTLQTGNSQLATHGIARNLKRSAPM